MIAPWSDSEWLIVHKPLNKGELDMIGYACRYDLVKRRRRQIGQTVIGVLIILVAAFVFCRWSVKVEPDGYYPDGPGWLGALELIAAGSGSLLMLSSLTELDRVRDVQKFLTEKRSHFSVIDMSDPYWCALLGALQQYGSWSKIITELRGSTTLGSYVGSDIDLHLQRADLTKPGTKEAQVFAFQLDAAFAMSKSAGKYTPATQ